MSAIGNIAQALEDGGKLRTVLTIALESADELVTQQGGAIVAYKQARAALVRGEAEVAEAAAEKARIAVSLTRSAYETGRNDAERKALAAEVLAKSEGYARLEQVEREAVGQRAAAEVEVEVTKELLRLGQTRLTLANSALNALAALTNLSRTDPNP